MRHNVLIVKEIANKSCQSQIPVYNPKLKCKIVLVNQMNTANTNTANTDTTATAAKPTKSTKPATTKGEPKRGLKKAEVVALLKSFKFPSEPFTVRQVYCDIGARHWLIRSYVKKNAKIVGDAPKATGANGKARGKAAKLYQLPADKLTY